jgi:hypothetical protein
MRKRSSNDMKYGAIDRVPRGRNDSPKDCSRLGYSP